MAYFQNPPLAKVVKFHQRLKLHLIVLFAITFLGIYGRLVCPFIDSLTTIQLATSLSIVTFFHLLLRELLFFIPTLPQISFTRFGFYISVLSWIIAGIIAMFVHAVIYPDFPWASHIKLLTGYWALGAGMLSQLEYALFERNFRFHAYQQTSQPQYRSDSLSKRLLESFTVFTIVPAIAMLLLVMRYIYEKVITPGVAVEILFLSTFLVTVALIVAWYWGQTLKEDTENILRGLDDIGEGNFDVTLRIGRSDELGQVAHYINNMTKGLGLRERIKEAFGRFVSPEVAERFIREHIQNEKAFKMGGEKCEVTVLMCDLRNFTPLSETMPPEQLTEYLNTYFSEMVQAIRSHHGIVDKFIGDAIMAVFGIADQEEDSPISAVKAAIAMKQGLETFNASCAQSKLPVLQHGIGIHVGEVVAGYIGSLDRLEFTVIGRTVNIAARIEAQTKSPNPPILFSQEVVQRIQTIFPVVSIGKIKLKGVEQPLELFSIEKSV